MRPRKVCVFDSFATTQIKINFSAPLIRPKTPQHLAKKKRDL
jgi:hypothetical protein